MRPSHEATDLFALSLIPPTYAGQHRVVRLNTRVPIFIEVEAVESVPGNSKSLQWKTVTIVSEEGVLYDDADKVPATTPPPPTVRSIS